LNLIAYLRIESKPGDAFNILKNHQPYDLFKLKRRIKAEVRIIKFKHGRLDTYFEIFDYT